MSNNNISDLLYFNQMKFDALNELNIQYNKIDMNNPQLADEEFIAKYYKNGKWDFNLYCEDEFERIKDEKLKEIRENTLANRQILNLIQFYEHYSSKIHPDDIASIFKSKKILDSLILLSDTFNFLKTSSNIFFYSLVKS